LSGTYGTRDPRAPGAVLILGPNGTFTLTGSPKGSGSGTYALKQEYGGDWEIEFLYPGNGSIGDFYWSGHRVAGARPPYEVHLFMSDPDEGVVVFKKRATTTTTRSSSGS
jgi:hypothetical protein